MLRLVVTGQHVIRPSVSTRSVLTCSDFIGLCIFFNGVIFSDVAFRAYAMSVTSDCNVGRLVSHTTVSGNRHIGRHLGHLHADADP